MEYEDYLKSIETMDLQDKIEEINKIKLRLHEISPFNKEPVDCVLWIKQNEIIANDYNPNKVAPPEMKLLEHSINEDGYTQPIVTWKMEDKKEVIDGFHRNRVGRENKEIKERIYGYLPVVVINPDREDRGDRISATIRHNRARGKHQIDSMTDIVVELKRRNWSNEKIQKNLGMDEDEILRLCQISGLTELFTDKEFSKSWDIEKNIDDFIPIDDDIQLYGDETKDFRTINTDDEDRIFHTYDKWECYKHGFYNTTFKGKTKKQCEEEYALFFSNEKLFEETLLKVITEWKYSCEHYLTNKSMNRIAWLGQASMCYYSGIPATYRNGFNLLTEEQQNKANIIALKYLNMWLVANNRSEVNMEEAIPNIQMEIY